MHKPWFRFYSEVVDDPKVQELPPQLFKAWVNMLCIASKYEGQLPPVQRVSYHLRITQARAEGLIQELETAGLFECRNNVYYPHNWEGRQFQSDVSTSRVKKFRELQKERHGNGNGNVSETTNETCQSRTEQSRTPKVPISVEDYSPEFEVDFWFVYPKKVGKGAAYKAWKKIKPSAEVREQIRSAIESARKSDQWLKDRGQFIPNPATWLNENRWHDEPFALTRANSAFKAVL